VGDTPGQGANGAHLLILLKLKFGPASFEGLAPQFD
jgi:hypothetical protein